MYLSELKLWNFRKYSKHGGALDVSTPHLVVPFKKGLNVLIGENDSGKTAIIDAIKIVLRTHAIEWIHLEDKDFYKDTDTIRIELKIEDMTNEEACLFTEWLSWDKTSQKPFLRVIYKAQKLQGRVLQGEVTAGAEVDGKTFTSLAREYLKTVYLNALRDASVELTAKKNSRVSQILQGHELFKEDPEQEHPFVSYVRKANNNINTWFNDDTPQTDENGASIAGTSNKEMIKGKIDSFLQAFINSNTSSSLTIADPKIRSILDTISIVIEQSQNLGLGTMNRLYMATELLHLNKKWDGLKLCLIEELEAHLHPQAQMKVVSALQEQNVQFIMSTHSPNLASKIKISDLKNTNLLLCYGTEIYPLNTDVTRLDSEDCIFLEHFLDATKANLFFSKGIILVEGWAEELLLPVLANRVGLNLTNHEVSVINVGSTAYIRYANIFIRKDGKKLDLPVSIVTDLDVSPAKLKKEEEEEDIIEYAEISSEEEHQKAIKIQQSLNLPVDSNVKLYLAPHWTLEWCLYHSTALKNDFMNCVSLVHSKTAGFKKGEDGSWNETTFKQSLISKLKNRTLDKVAIAHELCKRLNKKTDLNILENDNIYYLLRAIKHACNQ